MLSHLWEFAPDDPWSLPSHRVIPQSSNSNCNLHYKNSFYIPIVFHNLSGYDAHFIIKEIATAYDGHVDVLSIKKKKYISFTKHVDSIKDKNEKNFQKKMV